MDMDSAKWYYLWAGQQQGPMSANALQGLLKSGALPSMSIAVFEDEDINSLTLGDHILR